VIQLKMTEPYYNLSEHGPGMEGFVNYANVLVNGWLSILFILFIWLATIYVGSKSEWKNVWCNVIRILTLSNFLGDIKFIHSS